MANINFVPDDYIESNESRRTNLMYLVLFMVVMAGLGGSFVTIKMRQRALDAKAKLVNARLARAAEAIEQFEQLQTKRKGMMKTALTTAELLEPVPRSVLLASLTNNLPVGVSLMKLSLVQKEPAKTGAAAPSSRYAKAQTRAVSDEQQATSGERLLEMNIDIEGIAPTDRQVAAYIECLNNSCLLTNVALVESKEHTIEDAAFRQFKLQAKLRKDVHLSKDDIEKIRAKGEKLTGVF
ncbi:MAG TPA: PilN domain-containing protein [Sedimentisphaerales bacterium]|nr:PilN domain-containing protein [Sedimentisphaerales bacterium]